MVYFEPDLLSANWPQFLIQGTYFSAGVVPATNPDGTIRLVAEGPRIRAGAFADLWTLTPNGHAAPQTMQSCWATEVSSSPSVANLLDGSSGDAAGGHADFSNGIEVFRGDNSLLIHLASTTERLDYTRSSDRSRRISPATLNYETLGLAAATTITQLDMMSLHGRANGTLLNNNFPIQIAD